jgi:transposase InsO family protein
MSPQIDANLTLGALRDALEKHPPGPGWIHHSDRGSQYCCDAYVKAIEAAGGSLSCSAKGCPYDNAFMESFFKTLKAEEVWLEDYQSIVEADTGVSRFIDLYNTSRKHSSLGYLSPDQFEANHRLQDPS